MKVLSVRQVGFHGSVKDDLRSPESFCLPACVTSLAAYLGEDVHTETIHAHNRDWEKRGMIDEIQAACGISFGLLWHDENCPSCMDLTQVHEDHDAGIRYAFDYLGYECEFIEKTEGNLDAMKAAVVRSIDAGLPVLAFGVAGPPECAIVCGYDAGGDVLLGWSHFQSRKSGDCAENGMFKAPNWHGELWKIVLCGNKKEPAREVRPIVERGLAIMRAHKLSGYHAGYAAYDKWMEYVSDPAYEAMEDGELKSKHWLHNTVTGNHAEARAYLGGYLHHVAGNDNTLHDAAKRFDDIHDTCWKVWGTLGGHGKPEGYKGLREADKRAELARLIGEMRALDKEAEELLAGWLGK